VVDDRAASERDWCAHFALDTHSFLALRRLHEWLDHDDPFAKRLWGTLRHRDWVYLAVLLHETNPASAGAIARRCGLADDAVATVEALVADYHLLADVASQRDLHDEDLLLDIGARIGTGQRLRMLFLVSIAHALAAGGDAWSPWRAALLRRCSACSTARCAPRPSSARAANDRLSNIANESRAHWRTAISIGFVPTVARLPRRYLLTRSSAFITRHLALAAGEPLLDGEVRLRAEKHRRAAEWDLLVVARDRPACWPRWPASWRCVAQPCWRLTPPLRPTDWCSTFSRSAVPTARRWRPTCGRAWSTTSTSHSPGSFPSTISWPAPQLRLKRAAGQRHGRNSASQVVQRGRGACARPSRAPVPHRTRAGEPGARHPPRQGSYVPRGRARRFLRVGPVRQQTREPHACQVSNE